MAGTPSKGSVNPPAKPTTPTIKSAPAAGAVQTKARVVSVGGKAAEGAQATQRLVAPAFRIVSPEDANRQRYLKFLVYADYGKGKTYLCGTSIGVPQMRDVIMINAEGGDLTLDSKEFDFDLIDRVPCTDFKAISFTYEYLKLHCQYRDAGDDDKLRILEARYRSTPEKPVKPEDIEKPKRYRTVILDSLAEMEAYNMYQLLGVSDTTKLHEEMQSAEWSEYKKNHSMIARTVRLFRDLPMHVLMTCPDQYSQDDQKRLIYSPMMTGKLSKYVQGFMDVVGFLQSTVDDSKKIHRRLYVQPVGRFAAKCRFSNFKGNYFDDPTIGSILEQVGLASKLV